MELCLSIKTIKQMWRAGLDGKLCSIPIVLNVACVFIFPILYFTGVLDL